MSKLALTYSILSGDYAKETEALTKPIGLALSAAMNEAAIRAKVDSRASFAAAGFSKRWQNALRVDSWPRPTVPSLDAAAKLKHNIWYAEVFQKGAAIHGHPYLWLPLPNAPKRAGRTPSKLLQSGVDNLIFFKSRNGTPLLGARVKVSANRKNISLNALRRGVTGTRGKVRTVPLYVGIPMVDIPKKVSAYEALAKQRDNIPKYYAEHFNARPL